jgi:hypothetical protein
MPDIMNDNDNFSPVELMIKRRIYHKLIMQKGEDTGIVVKRYALSPNFSPAAVLNNDEKEIFFKVV